MDAKALAAQGWKQIETPGFSEQVGPFWVRPGEGTGWVVGFLATEKLTNNHIHTVHGGALMTFADVALGYTVVQLLGGTNCVTVQLQMQFVSTARFGEFVSCATEVVRQSSSLVFMRGLMKANGRTVASADGMWKVL